MDPGISQGLETRCGFGEAAEIPPAHCQHSYEARYHSSLREHQEYDHHGAERPMGGPLGRSSRKKDDQI